MAFLSRYGYLALLLFVFAETSLLFPFLPSELVMPAAAAVLVTGSVSALAFVGVAALGTVAGSLFAYYVFGAGSSRVVDRFGSYVRVSEPEIERAQRWFGRWGESSVFWGRLLPGLRSVISIPAGFARMNVVKFLLYSGTGGKPVRRRGRGARSPRRGRGPLQRSGIARSSASRRCARLGPHATRARGRCLPARVVRSLARSERLRRAISVPVAEARGSSSTDHRPSGHAVFVARVESIEHCEGSIDQGL